ncbi:hypothetical protein WN944_013334 [Citrus x changshan-huyou]|uniref:Centromere protein X n=1 Tax=Citrus x changshan-huyou TaxID=2935761 RepID=A0AAP0M3M9_9ROSI
MELSFSEAVGFTNIIGLLVLVRLGVGFGRFLKILSVDLFLKFHSVNGNRENYLWTASLSSDDDRATDSAESTASFPVSTTVIICHSDYKRERNGGTDAMESEFLLHQAGAGTSKKNRPTSANANALKLSCELLRVFVTEAVQRAAAIAEAEGVSKIEATHLERILPQLLLDF